jgi:hypothetical protein
MDYCTRCRQPVEAGTQFCPGCGARLVPVGTIPSPRQAPATVSTPVPPPRQEPQQRAVAPPSPPPPRHPRKPRKPQSERPRRPRNSTAFWGAPTWAILTGTVLVIGICGAVVAIFLFGSPAGDHAALSGNDVNSSLSRPQQQQSSPAASPAPTTPVTPAVPAEEVAAQHLSDLLAQSASDRGAIVSAVNDVNACGSDLSGDAQTFQQAATSRQRLLSQLSSLPDESALPAQLVTDLAGAWQSSAHADQDFAGWANDENSGGCTPSDSSDANFQAATAPDDQATTDKQAFVSLWNPIATRYGLTAYQWNEL